MRRLLPLAFLLIVPIALSACGGGSGGGPSTVSTVTTTVTQCDFSKPVKLRATTRYGIFGDDEFDTLACGYLKLINELGGESGNVPITSAFLVLVDYADEGFSRSVDAGIHIGNDINRKGEQHDEFSLGCYEEGRIVGTERADSNPYVDAITEQAIVNSSPGRPVSLILSFGIHGGSGCVCCSLAHRVRLY